MFPNLNLLANNFIDLLQSQQLNKYTVKNAFADMEFPRYIRDLSLLYQGKNVFLYIQWNLTLCIRLRILRSPTFTYILIQSFFNSVWRHYYVLGLCPSKLMCCHFICTGLQSDLVVLAAERPATLGQARPGSHKQRGLTMYWPGFSVMSLQCSVALHSRS